MNERDAFIDRERQVWGDDHIDDLIERGYVPVLISSPNGSQQLYWRWLYLTNEQYSKYAANGLITLDTSSVSC